MAWRKIGTIALVVVTSLLVLIASIAVWGKRTLFDTNRFTRVFAGVVSDPAVTDAVANRLTDSVFDAVQESGVVAENVPDNLKPLLPVISGAVRGWVSTEVEQFLASDTGQRLMVGAVSRAHSAVMRVLDGKSTPGDAVSVQDGVVTLNLVPAVNRVLGRLQGRGILTDKDLPTFSDSQSPAEQVDELNDALGTNLPATFGQVTVFENDRIADGEAIVASARQVAKQIKKLVVLLVILALVFIAVTIVVAHNRRKAVIWLGIGVAFAVVLSLLIERRLVAAIPRMLGNADSREAAQSVARSFTDSLNNVNVSLFTLAVLTALIGFMARPGGLKLRGHSEVAQIVIAALGVGALWVLGLHWWSLLFVAAFVAVGFGAVKRANETSEDEAPPPGPPSDVGATSASTSS